MFVKVTNGQIDQYPYTVGNLRRDYPKTSFPRKIPLDVLAEYGVFPVKQGDKPSHDPSSERVTDADAPRLIGGEWVLSKKRVPLTSEELAARKDQQRIAIRDRRDEAIAAGTTVGGMNLATDDLSQQRITGAALAATIDGTTTVNWKMPNGSFVTLSAAQIIAIAQGVRAHVQACFDREAELLAAFEAGDAYDIDAGWP